MTLRPLPRTGLLRGALRRAIAGGCRTEASSNCLSTGSQAGDRQYPLPLLPHQMSRLREIAEESLPEAV